MCGDFITLFTAIVKNSCKYCSSKMKAKNKINKTLAGISNSPIKTRAQTLKNILTSLNQLLIQL